MPTIISISKCILLTLLLTGSACWAGAQETKQQFLFNTNWKFHKGDVDAAQEPGYNDNDWRPLQLPHDWSIEGPFNQQWASATGFLPGGVGWYRKTFTAAASWQGKKIYLYFDGVYNNSEVWINGHYLGKRPNGFIPFQYELTPFLKFNGENVIAVKADHSRFADSRWYTGSGIYRNVYLQVMNPVHIDLWGVQFSTPVATTKSATATVRVTIKNTVATATPVSVIVTLTDKNNKQVAVTEQAMIAAATTATTAAVSFQIPTPKLWSVDDPYLYSLQVSVRTNGKTTDEWSEKVGVRSFRFDANKGFFLNNISLKQKGVCLHDDAGVLGVAVPEEVWIRRLRALKEMGCNAIRMSHNPHAGYLYRLCDELGFLVTDEAFDEWEEGKNKWIAGWNKGTPGKDGYHHYFKEWADTDLRDMILRNYNHPSVILWSIGNEIDYPNDPYSAAVLSQGSNPQIFGRGYMPDHPAAERLGALSARLVQAVKKYDTTRPVTAALAGVVMSNTTNYPGNLDITGYNYQEYRYAEDHQKYPDRIIYGSENGMQLGAWLAVDTNTFISGQYLWTGIDYLGEAGQWSNRSNTAGLLNLGGFPKPEYYFRQSLWAQQPMIYIGTANIPKTEDRGIWSHKQAAPVWQRRQGELVRVNCFTNCTEAELLLNGQSLGRKKRADAKNLVIYWDLAYQPGELVVVGYNNGKPAAQYALHTPGAIAMIQATVHNDPLIPSTGLKQIEITLTDSNGNRVYNASNTVAVSIKGNAKLLGLENSDSHDVEGYHSGTVRALNGQLIAYVLPGKEESSFEVQIQSPGLKTAVLSFK